jgi:hypothetical protein
MALTRYNGARKEARDSRLFSLVLSKQDVEGSNPFTRSTYQRFAKGDLALQIITDEGKPLWKPLPHEGL